jgi:hypothetical protein
LTFGTGHGRKNHTQRFAERHRGCGKRRALSRHRRPFLLHSLLNVLAEQCVYSRPQIIRKICGEKIHRPERTGFAAHLGAGALGIVPDLRREKRDEQSEHDTQR